MHVFKGHKNIVNCLDITDSDIYSGSWDMTVIRWSRAVRRKRLNCRLEIQWAFLKDILMEFNVYSWLKMLSSLDPWTNLYEYGIFRFIYTFFQMHLLDTKNNESLSRAHGWYRVFTSIRRQMLFRFLRQNNSVSVYIINGV